MCIDCAIQVFSALSIMFQPFCGFTKWVGVGPMGAGVGSHKMQPKPYFMQYLHAKCNNEPKAKPKLKFQLEFRFKKLPVPKSKSGTGRGILFLREDPTVATMITQIQKM